MHPQLTHVNLISGSLGSGKTTLIRHLLSQKPSDERWTLLVNEFGVMGIDGGILSGHHNVQVVELPGGCICCSAQNELKQSLQQILDATQYPHRILIEPTGLGEPDVIYDILLSLKAANRIRLQTFFAVIDSAATRIDDLNTYTIQQNLLNMADVILLNKQDLAQPEQIAKLQAHCRSLYPPKDPILCNHAEVDQRLIDLPTTTPVIQEPGFKTILHHTDRSGHSHTTSPQQDKVTFSHIDFGVQVKTMHKREQGVLSLGYEFDAKLIFDWQALQRLFESLPKLTGLVKIQRAKGLFKVGKPWMLFQWSQHHVSREYIAYRRDSRFELLIKEEPAFNLEAFEQELKNCIRQP
ncbi:CobW family GTP-binding protein [Thiomicrorhabdus chilensis]|uniref:CobW family GTP-binding protein n=1 Tax=Thiomicrorhabdus chilensis TaxID=63656 RepID=UPI0004289210|nr:GTP-binding protein [Thiomicrorhabdus chilensis]